MATTGIIPQPIKHKFEEINIGKFKGTKHYQLNEVVNGKSELSETINICNDRGFARSNPTYWLKIREGKKWVVLTGLFATANSCFFVADKGKSNVKEALIFVQFNHNQQTVIVYYFKDYYTTDINKVLRFLNQ